ncbi:MAG: ABC transporter ATP-binding protein [Myxococcota bacterium]|jgi:ABC-2 type transport system ATP-binding protein|nr:ABC transporter ATP-binding protein [Myxococcota bacterium]
MNEQITKEYVVAVNELHKTFHVGFFRKQVQAVRGISFNVGRGEIFGLLGPNGAGKTTTIKVAMGLIGPTSGSVTIDGKHSHNPASRTNIGYLPENPYFHEYLTPEELLDFHGRMCGLPKATRRKRRDELIEKVGLKEAARRPLRKFSKGMLQRIGLAQALIGDPQFLVLDEPMSGLDPIGRRFVAELIEELNRQGKTILFSSHILSDVERLCHRVVILHKGKKVAEGTLEELLKKEAATETLESLFMRKALESGE